MSQKSSAPAHRAGNAGAKPPAEQVVRISSRPHNLQPR